MVNSTVVIILLHLQQKLRLCCFRWPVVDLPFDLKSLFCSGETRRKSVEENGRSGSFCGTSWSDNKVVALTLLPVVAVGGGPEPPCSRGDRRSQEKGSKINLEKFQSPLEAGEFS